MLDKRRRRLSKKDRSCRNLIDYGILGLIVFSPLPAASINEWSILVIQLVVLIMVGAYILMDKKPACNKSLLESLKWPKYLFIGFFVLIFVQIIPWPKFLIKIISPNGYLYLERYFSDFQSTSFASFSLIPSYTLREGLELLTYFLLGFLVIKTVTKRDDFKRIISVLIAMGVFQAIYGLIQLYSNNPRILFYRKVFCLDSATGTFVNRNHFAGYLEMVIPLALGLVIARIDLFSLERLSLKERLNILSEKRTSTFLLTIIGIIIMCMGIIFSKSRSGIFLLGFSFFLIFGFSTMYMDKKKPQKKWIRTFLVVVFLIIVIGSLQIGISSSMDRFAMDDLLREGRPGYWANTARIFSDFPLLGTGLGTFTSIYPDWEANGVPIRLFHAHNDYLEYLSELGLIGMILLLGGILIIMANTFLVWRKRNISEIKGIALGGLVATISILVHSITDFNLHMPANMMLFSIVLSLTAAIAYYKKDESSR